MPRFQTSPYVTQEVRVVGLSDLNPGLEGVLEALSDASPEGLITAPPGSICHVKATPAGSDDGLWIKNSGTGSTGWVRAVGTPTGSGNIVVSAGTQSSSLSAVTFANSNNLSFGLSAGVITASGASTPTIALSAGTQLASTGTIVFSNSNNVSFGLSGSSRLTASIPAGATATGNFGGLGAGTQTATSGTVVLANSNGISFGMSGSSQITASYTVPSTAGLISAIKISGGTLSSNVSAVTLSNANNVSFGYDGTNITASASYSQSTSPAAIAAGTQTAASGTILFSNSNNISFGMSGSSRITASFLPTINFSAGTSTANSSAVSFADSNGISFGLSGNATITATHDGIRSIVLPDYGATMFGTQAQLMDGVNASFYTLGGAKIGVSVSAPGLSVSGGISSGQLTGLTFSNSNNVTFGLSNGTLTGSISVSGTSPINTYLEPYPIHFAISSLYTNASLASVSVAGISMFEFFNPSPLNVELAGIVISQTMFSNKTAIQWSQTGAFQFGLYSKGTGTNTNILGQVKTASLGYSISYTNGSYTFSQATTTNAGGGYGYGTATASTTDIASNYTGLKLVQLGIGAQIGPGPYWLGILHTGSYAGSTNGLSMSLMGNQYQLTNLAPFGSASTNYSTGTNIPLDIGGNFHLGQGVALGTTNATMPVSISMSGITQTGNMIPFLRLLSRV